MSAKIIDGKRIAEEILENIKAQVDEMRTKPVLAIINASEDPASEIYIKAKIKACEKTGIGCEVIIFDSNCTQKEVVKKIKELNNNEKISGIIVQLPLWKHLDEEEILNTVLPKKDADGLTDINLGRLFGNKKGIVPATPHAILKAIEDVEVSGKNAVVVGRSKLVGKPLAHLLLQKDFTVTVCHSKTENLGEFTKNADLLVSAVGKKDLITKSMAKSGAVVIDVGISRFGNKIYGDVSKDVCEIASYITAVPGGIGPITVACLLESVVEYTK